MSNHTGNAKAKQEQQGSSNPNEELQKAQAKASNARRVTLSSSRAPSAPGFTVRWLPRTSARSRPPGSASFSRPSSSPCCASR